MEQPIIEIRHLQKHFGDLHVLHDIDFNVNKGEVVTITVSYTHLTLPTICSV